LAVMVGTAVGLYLVEGSVQPEAFGSIPRALWWSLETLTTVGYGDVFPQTVLGKLLAGLFALAGIGIVAIPTGILAAAFGEAFRAEKSARPSAAMKPGMRSRVAGSVPANEEKP
jgi:voltage-gated potassium channel